MVSRALKTITLEAWRHLEPRDLRHDERMRLEQDHLDHLGDRPGPLVMRIYFFRVDRETIPLRESFRWWETEAEIDDLVREMERSRSGDPRIVTELLRRVESAIRYLIAMVRPVRKPTGYRLLCRHVVKTTQPKRVWRRFSARMCA